MQKNIFRILRVLVVLGLLVWYGAFLAKKIDLTTADLGRHIQNGQVLVHGAWSEKLAILNTNFYSYTETNQPFVNHHWLTGVVLYFVYNLFGFTGLSVFYVLAMLAAVFVFWDAARRQSNFWIATAAVVYVLPLIASRTEVRPEAFTYLFTGLFYWILANLGVTMYDTQKSGIRPKLIWILPILMLLWVNLHIGFVFGFLVLGAFGLAELVKLLGKKSNQFLLLLKVSVACVIAGFINPFGYHALVYPLSIFKDYGYTIVENQSIPFLERLHFTGQHFLLFKLLTGGLVVLLGFVLAINWRKFPAAEFVLVGASGALAYFGIRHFPSFALFAIPALAMCTFALWEKLAHQAYKLSAGIVVAGLLIIALNSQYQNWQTQKQYLGFGLFPGVEYSAEFYKDQHIQGPVISNYDIGGYLIYELYPEKVYVDNRPEAYSVQFLQNRYIAALQDNEAWQKEDALYHFNAIFFSHRDYTPWGQAFLIARVEDPAWAPVYVDGFNIIFLRRDNQANAEIIKKYEIPKSRFGIK